MPGRVQLDVRGPRTHPARSVEARRAGANGPEAGAGKGSRRTGNDRTFQQGVACEAYTSEGAACAKTRAPEGGIRKETRVAETATAEARASKLGTPKAGPASASRPSEGRVVRANGTLPRGHCG